MPINNLCDFGQDISSISKEILTWENFDPIALHNKFFASKKYNFLGLRIQLPTRINLDKFDRLANGYWDWQLPILLRFGFPLDFPGDARSQLISSEENHASAVNYPQDIEKYLDTEIKHSAIFGPYTAPPFGKSTQTSPFMSRPKPDSGSRHIIIDLSWPQQASVNYFTKRNVYLNTVYQLKYPTVDTITEHLCKLGKQALLYKIDLARAFRQLPVDPYDYNLLTLKWKNSYFCDLYTPFGHSGGVLLVADLQGSLGI